MNSDSVELLPNPSTLIQSMRHIGYTLETALADIIDNSIAANASRISVQYRWNNADPWIAIIDDGCGMSTEEIKEAMRFGGAFSPAHSRSTSDLGRFGLGLKTASLSQCRRLTVISKQSSIISACVWDVDILSNSSSPKWNALLPTITVLKEDPVIEKLLPRLASISSGTIVVWQKLDNLSATGKKESAENNFSEMMNHASKHVGLVFHRFFVMEKGYNAIKIDYYNLYSLIFLPFDEYFRINPSLFV